MVWCGVVRWQVVSWTKENPEYGGTRPQWVKTAYQVSENINIHQRINYDYTMMMWVCQSVRQSPPCSSGWAQLWPYCVMMWVCNSGHQVFFSPACRSVWQGLWPLRSIISPAKFDRKININSQIHAWVFMLKIDQLCSYRCAGVEDTSASVATRLIIIPYTYRHKKYNPVW